MVTTWHRTVSVLKNYAGLGRRIELGSALAAMDEVAWVQTLILADSE